MQPISNVQKFKKDNTKLIGCQKSYLMIGQCETVFMHALEKKCGA